MRPYIHDLFRRMRDPDPVRRDAAFDAVLFEREDALPDLYAAYEQFHDDALLRFFAVQLMGFAGSKKAVGVLIVALDDPDPAVRAEACRSLEDLRARKAVQALRARQDDLDPEVRRAAHEALAVLQK